MKKLIAAMLFLSTFLISQTGPRYLQDSQTISASGGTATFVDPAGVSQRFEYVISGAPASMSLVIQGCMRGGTCDSLDTYSGTTNSNRFLSVNYDSYIITGTWSGGTNVVVKVNRLGTAARNFSGSGTTGSSANSTIADQATSSTAAISTIHAYGDSNTALPNIWLLNSANNYINRLGTYFGIPSTAIFNRAAGGLQACDMMPNEILPNDTPTIVGPQTLNTMMIGTNDTTAVNGFGAGPYEAVYNKCAIAALSWLAIPNESKLTGGAVIDSAAFTGACTKVTTYAAGPYANCTSNGATLTFAFTSTASNGPNFGITGATSGNTGPIYIWYLDVDSDAGTYTYSLDGKAPVAVVTGGTPVMRTATNGFGITTSFWYIRISNVSAGAHTITFNKTNASGNMGVLGVGSPSNALYNTLPIVEVGDVPPKQDGTTLSDVNAYRADIASQISLLRSDGLRVYAAMVSQNVAGTTAAGDMGQQIHMNDIGHQEVFNAFLSPLKLFPPGQYSKGLPQTLFQSAPAMDLVCAHAADTTIGISAGTITGATNADPVVFTTSFNPQINGFWIGENIDVGQNIAINPVAYDGSYQITATTSSSITAKCISGCTKPPGAAYVSGGNINLRCGNQVTDAITSTPFTYQPSVTIGTTFGANTDLDVVASISEWSTATSAPQVTVIPNFNASLNLWTAGAFTPPTSANNVSGDLHFKIFSPVLSAFYTTLDSQTVGGFFLSPLSLTRQPTYTAITSAMNFEIGISFAATGIASGTYTSGITATGTIGQTCALSAFNNGNAGGTATVALTGTNTIAASTPLVITNTGISSTSAATSATVGNGTATCTGPATVATVLGGAQGNAWRLNYMTGRLIQQ